MSGRELSQRFYAEVVRPTIDPVLGDAPYAAAMLGDGSDVLGYDDDVSPDHDFGPESSSSWLSKPTPTRSYRP